MRSDHRKPAAVCAVLAILAAIPACGGGHPAPDRRAKAHGRLYAMNRALRIGVKTDEPGIAFADATGTNLTGLDIDIAKQIAAALHDQPVFQPVVSSTREQMLRSQAVDLVIASYSISEERLTKIDFAGPYLIAGQDTLIRSDDTSITSIDALRNKITCGVIGSNSPTRLAVRFSGSENVANAWGKRHLKLLLGYGGCLPLLLNKTVDAVSTDDSILAGYANDPRYKGRVRLLGQRFPSHREKYGIGIAKGDPADVTLINATLRQMIGDGRWARIIRQNLGDSASLFLKPEDRPVPP